MFIEILAAILFGNIMTASFIWGMVTYARFEREERILEIPRHVYVAVFMPVVFTILSILAVYGF